MRCDLWPGSVIVEPEGLGGKPGGCHEEPREPGPREPGPLPGRGPPLGAVRAAEALCPSRKRGPRRALAQGIWFLRSDSCLFVKKLNIEEQERRQGETSYEAQHAPDARVTG